MNNKTTNIAKKYQPIIARLFVIAIIALAWTFVTPSKTLAVENNSPGVPGVFDLTNFYGSPPCNRDHAQANWISPTTNSAIYGTYYLAAGQDSLSLRMNTVAAVCDQNIKTDGFIRNINLSQTSTTYMRAINTNTAGITTSGISLNSNTQLFYNCMNFWNLRFAKVCPGGLAGADYNNTPVNLPFTVSGFNSLAPGTHNITLSSEVKLLNTFDGPIYKCVGGDEQTLGNILLFGQCVSTFPSYTITVVKPAPTYLGQIQTLKYDTTTGVLATNQDMKNAKTYIDPCGGSAICSNVGSNNWLTGVYMWVYQGGPGFGNGVQNIHSSKIDVPSGYRVNNARLNRNTSPVTNVTPTTTAEGKLLCTGSDNTGTCSIGTKVWNGGTTFVDWFLEKIPEPIEYFPWLQTKNGDVTSADYQAIKGKITGQKIGSATDSNNRRGARRAGTGTAAATVAESSFVVAASDAGDYFCAQERFVLGKPLADRDNLDDGSCNTGGYAPSPVNFDKVKASIAKAYADNGNGVAKSPATPNACNPKYATTAVAVGTQPNLVIDLGCPAGGIQKIGGQGDTVTLSSLPTVNGRGTLWIPGKLVINNDIKYSTTNSTNDPKTTPNLVIFVEGDVEIAPNVLQIDASIISKGTISTCNQSTVSTRACENKLVINGFLASDNKKINFARRYYASPYATATPSPAELINLTSQSTTFPAPGLDRTDTDVTSKLQINSGELAPRLR